MAPSMQSTRCFIWGQRYPYDKALWDSVRILLDWYPLKRSTLVYVYQETEARHQTKTLDDEYRTSRYSDRELQHRAFRCNQRHFSRIDWSISFIRSKRLLRRMREIYLLVFHCIVLAKERKKEQCSKKNRDLIDCKNNLVRLCKEI